MMNEHFEMLKQVKAMDFDLIMGDANTADFYFTKYLDKPTMI